MITNKEQDNQRNVRFSENVVEPYTPSRKPHFSAVRRRWIQRSVAGEYNELEKDIAAWKQRGLDLTTFFNREGRALLNWAINYPSSQPLKFICDIVKPDEVKDLMSVEGAYLSEVFLLTEAQAEGKKNVTEADLRERRAKVRSLVLIFPEIEQCMEREVSSIVNLTLREGAIKVIQSCAKSMRPNSSPGNDWVS